MLTKEEFRKYQKQIMLDDIGIVGQIKLNKAKWRLLGREVWVVLYYNI
jgi:molybdopterin/thiamine biosynthesis adenylyltransferase